MLKFVPLGEPRAPALFVGINDAVLGGEFVFECVDQDGEAAVRTFHASLPDALQQVVHRMRIDCAYLGERIDYRVDTGA